ncbi:MAG: HIT domain-containing protein [Cryobacterium sp.]|nr:HIT domain-containing protein [Cryobacterium sp.]
MVSTASCPFCAIIDGKDDSAQIVLRTDRIIVFPPLHPATRGHLLVVPIKHSSDIAEMSSADLHAVTDGVQRVRKAVASALGPSGVNIIQSNGELATQTVPHVHFHVVPRWADDKMQLDWPSAEESVPTTAQDLEDVRQILPPQSAQVSPEDRRQHLSFIQAVITRMAQASASAKTWLLPIVTATFGFAFAQKEAVVALLGVIAVLVFALLDANYLKQERAFRNLYDKVAVGGDLPEFAMNPSLAGSEGKQNYWPDAKDIWSWSIAPFYLPLALSGIGLCVWLSIPG